MPPSSTSLRSAPLHAEGLDLSSGGLYASASVVLRACHVSDCSSTVQIGPSTRVWAAGMLEPQFIWALRELRWLTARRSGDESQRVVCSLRWQCCTKHVNESARKGSRV